MFDTLERFLRIDRFTTQSKLMRARAIYMMGMAFIATQAINLGAMYYSYGSLTFDHLVSVIACLLVLITVINLRRSDEFRVFALVFSVLIVGATLSSALNQNTGINSALIPFFVLGVIVNGFICGWRATIAFGFFATVCVWYLWWVSSNYDYTPIFDVENFTNRNFQRAVQASLAIILITIVGAFFSKNMHDAFGKLEAGIATAQQSDRAKTDFLATMSHELFTPLNGIIGMNDVLQETELDEEQREVSEIIQSSSRDLKAIIGNVLLFSQLENNHVSLDDAAFNLRDCLQDALRPFMAAAAHKGLKLRARVFPGVPHMIIGDRVRTGQLVAALVENAIKFTESGSIELSVHSRDAHDGSPELAICVADTGIGIAPEDQDLIFERFTQKDGSIKRLHGGTGLGLTIVRGLTVLMEGRVTVSSEVGVGSAFTLHLPIIDSKSETNDWPQAAE